jgi:hypothetical protein
VALLAHDVTYGDRQVLVDLYPHREPSGGQREDYLVFENLRGVGKSR